MTVALEFPANLAEDVAALLPPGHAAVPGSDAADEVVLRRAPTGLEIDVNGHAVFSGPDSDVALNAFDAQLRLLIATRAPDHVFVHAGCVAVDGRALVLPGRSFSGKSTLVAALLREGADYLSDEFAVLCPDGTVLAYPRPISLRATRSQPASEVDADRLGATVEPGPCPVAAVATITYLPTGTLQTEEVPAGAAALRLLEHTVPARERPAPALAAAARASSGAHCVAGTRGEAAQAAPVLLDLLTTRTTAGRG